jgi:hypothetical protein
MASWQAGWLAGSNKNKQANSIIELSLTWWQQAACCCHLTGPLSGRRALVALDYLGSSVEEVLQL